MQVSLAKLINGENEWSIVCATSGSIDYRCHVCGNDNIPLIECENSDCDNNWVTICKNCCLKIFEDLESV